MDSVGGGKDTQCRLGWQLRGRWAVVDVEAVRVPVDLPWRMEGASGVGTARNNGEDGCRVGGDGDAAR